VSDPHHHHEGGGDRTREEDAARWDERYAATDRLWSAEPNATVAEVVGSMAPARALDLGTGEGRHAVWLARRGWLVTAVDFSAVGIDRGRAESDGLAIDWVVADLRDWDPPAGASFDLVLSVYLHLPADVFIRARTWLAPGGTLVVLGHALRNLTEGVGGPQDPRLLHTEEQLLAAANGLEVDELREVLRPTADGDAIDLLLVARKPRGAS
jgi:SAM-dependent methyltransferase